MADPRYTDQAHALAVAIHDATCHDRTCPATVIAAVYGTAAVAALDHLTRRGLLLEPGGETETYWAVNSDLAARCDSGDIPTRLGERYSLAVLREIDRLRAEVKRLSARVIDDEWSVQSG